MPGDTSPGRPGAEIREPWPGRVPDRLILLPGGKLAFVEVKAPGQTLRPLQVRRKAQLEALGFQVYCLGGREQIPELINSILKER